MKRVALEPTSQKSFWGKAVVMEYEDGAKVLVSYNTKVAEITPEGTFRRLWSSYSSTTMKHINAFIACYGIAGGGKKWWEGLKVERDESLNSFQMQGG